MLEKIMGTELEEGYRTSKLVPRLFFLFFSIPFALFLYGWFKPIYSIPLFLILVISLFFALKHVSALWIPNFTKSDITKIIILMLIVSAWVCCSGIGGFVWQTNDHIIRNAVFNDLVHKHWPVVDLKTNSLLVYYIAFWLPAAAFGKVFGLEAGYVFQDIWAILFILFLLYFVFTFMKKIVIWPLVVLIFFSGMDIIPYYIQKGKIDIWHIDNHDGFEISSITTQLNWVFNQAVPAWTATVFMFSQKKLKSIVLVLALLLLYSPLPFFGILPFVLFIVLYDFYIKRKSNELKKTNILFQFVPYAISDVFSIENIIGGGVVGIASYLYLAANISGGHMHFIDLSHTFYLDSIALYLPFEVIFVALAIWLCGIRHPLIYITTGFLIFCPFYQIGEAYDFVMRASIPALIVLYLLTVAALKKTYKKQNKKIAFSILVMVLFFGAITPLGEMNFIFDHTIHAIANGLPLKQHTVNYFHIKGTAHDNLVGSLNSIFGKYFLK
ncbi:MAG: hypothetical protein Q8876_05960 [Bacillota bacterium]|nr:hypothetical protein [Bacillota bacterium]